MGERDILKADAIIEEAFWGPAPPREDIEAAHKQRNEYIRERIKRAADELLPGCLQVDELEFYLGVEQSIETAKQDIRDGKIIGFELGAEGSYWFPSWQFSPQEDGTHTPNKHILQLWKEWGSMQALAFCEKLKQESGATNYEDIPKRLQEVKVIVYKNGEGVRFLERKDKL
jgi:hypothetical protein